MTQPTSASTQVAHRGQVLLVAAAAALGGFLFGYDTAVINGTVDALKSDFNLSSGVLGFVVSSALLGCAVGAWYAGPLADRYGRLRVMIIAAIVFAIGSIGSAVAVGPIDLTAWRVLGGLAVGAASVIAPAYIAEIAPAEIRGRLGSLQQLAIVTGIFASQIINYAIAQHAGGASNPVAWGGDAWRWMFAVETIPALVYLVFALMIPESPRYLIRRGRVDEARKVLDRIVGGDTGRHIREIQDSLRGVKEKVELSDLKGPRFGLLPIVWVGILLSVFQQFVGINVIFYYSTTLWQAVGFTEDDSFLISVITSITNVVVTLVAIALVDKVGRKPLLLIGAAGMALTLGTMALAFSTATGSGDDVTLGPVWSKVALVAANLYVVAFGVSWGPVVWVLLGEMFNNKIRVTALAVAAAAQWLANWVISSTFPALSDLGLGLAYLVYTVFAALAFVFVLKAVRETKGRTLESM